METGETVEGWDKKTLATDSKNQQWDLPKNSKRESHQQWEGTIE